MAKDKNETPEQREERLERHKKYMEFVLSKFFKKKSSDVFGEEFYECKLDGATFVEEKDAIDHYFKNHWEKRNKNGSTEEK